MFTSKQALEARLKASLDNHRISLQDLASKPDHEIRKSYNVGPKTLAYIRQITSRHAPSRAD